MTDLLGDLEGARVWEVEAGAGSFEDSHIVFRHVDIVVDIKIGYPPLLVRLQAVSFLA